MCWKRGRRSDNVDDRRGRGPAMGGVDALPPRPLVPFIARVISICISIYRSFMISAAVMVRRETLLKRT